jgi:restriction system protein
MQFKDAAYEILKNEGRPLHYNEITDKALAAGLLDTTGKTPHASMGALLYTDTLKPDSRFRRGNQKGTFTLKIAPHMGIQGQIDAIQFKVRKDLRKHLLEMPPQKFEELIRLLLEEMGFEEAKVGPYIHDKGVDVRGVLQMDQLSTVKIAIQVKRWTANVGSNVVRNLRGALKVADAEQGLVITPSDFTLDAKAEAQAQGKTPISLINGEQLVDLLIRHQVGVKQEQYTVPSIDIEYWTEVLGVSLIDETPTQKKQTQKGKPDLSIEFPLAIQATHKKINYQAELLNVQGTVRLNGQEYATPSTAAKIIATDWKEVNGWDFWRYLDPVTGKREKIWKLRKST